MKNVGYLYIGVHILRVGREWIHCQIF